MGTRFGNMPEQQPSLDLTERRACLSPAPIEGPPIARCADPRSIAIIQFGEAGALSLRTEQGQGVDNGRRCVGAERRQWSRIQRCLELEVTVVRVGADNQVIWISHVRTSPGPTPSPQTTGTPDPVRAPGMLVV